MYKIPLTNSPNQTFSTTIPINGENKSFVFNLKYNYVAKYWLLTISDAATEQILIANIPLLSSTFDFASILKQFEYKLIGNAYVIPVYDFSLSAPDNTNVGTDFALMWGDNTYV